MRKGGGAEDRLLVSAGNDGNVVFWDLGGNMVGDGALDPASYLGGCAPSSPEPEAEAEPAVDATADAMDSLRVSDPKSGKKGKGAKGKGKRGASKDGGFPDDPITPSPPKILFKIAHRLKPNWIACSRASEAALPSSLFVVDTTNDISV